MKRCLLVALFIFCPAAAVAQDSSQPDDSVRFTTEVVVTPERTETPRALVPASTSVLQAAAILNIPAVNFANIVSFLPGFSIAQSEFHAGRPVLSARGFFGGGEAEYVLLLVDGVPVVDTESGLIDWAAVASSSIQRIEGSRGPGASMYGDSAVGGVLQVLTRQEAGLRATVAAGSFGTVFADGSVGRRFSRAGVTGSGAVRRTGGFATHASARELLGTISVDGRAKVATWRLSGSANGRNRDEPGALPLQIVRVDPAFSDPVYRFDDARRTGLATSFVVQHPTGRRTALLRVFANMRDDDAIRTVLLAPGVADRQQRTIASHAIGGTVQGGYTSPDANRTSALRFGVDLSRDDLRTTYRPVSDVGSPGVAGPEAAGHRIRAGAFASSYWDALRRLRVTGGLRWDWVRDTGFEAASASTMGRAAWSPRIGITVRATDAGKLAIFAQASKAFKAPTLDQLFDRRPYPDFRGGTFSISNAALHPQRAANVEAGISGTSRVTWSALVYRMIVEDEIDFDVRTFSYGNIGKSRHAGVELEAGASAGAWFRPSVAYAWTRVKDVSGGSQLKNVPRHTVALTGLINLPWAVGAYARYRCAAGAFFDDENTVALHGASTLDLRVRRAFHGQTVFVDAMNLTNNRYEEYGFTLTDFRGRLVPYAYPGAPRAIRVGISIGAGGSAAPTN